MNGAAMDCRKEKALHSQRMDGGGLHGSGYYLQINRPRQQNTQLQHSKAMNYQSHHCSVDGSSEYLQHTDYSNNKKNRHTFGDVLDPRTQPPRPRTREPLELPVPQFEIDENYVGKCPNAEDDKYSLVKNSKDLDLDTRIDLLIKSKALAGMHPIFSDLDESEESSYDSDDFLLEIPKSNRNTQKNYQSTPPEAEISYPPDDPETPLSRPPSPFLSRATYLFWFNKAIELKQQAKEQEQALLEKAAKKLLQGNVSPPKASQIDNANQEKKPLLKTLINEIRKELKETIKQEFIREVLENTALHTLEDWWKKQGQLEGDQLLDSSISNKCKDVEVASISAESRNEIPTCQSSSVEPCSRLNEDLKLEENLCDGELWNEKNVKEDICDIGGQVSCSVNIDKLDIPSISSVTSEETKDDFKNCNSVLSSSLPLSDEMVIDSFSLDASKLLSCDESRQNFVHTSSNCVSNEEKADEEISYVIDSILNTVASKVDSSSDTQICRPNETLLVESDKSDQTSDSKNTVPIDHRLPTCTEHSKDSNTTSCDREVPLEQQKSPDQTDESENKQCIQDETISSQFQETSDESGC